MRRRWFGRPVLGPVESRQGYLDRPVLVVLVIGLALVVAAFAILFFQVLA